MKKLGERREKSKVLFGRRLWEMEENRLVEMMVEQLTEEGGVGWREEHEVLVRKYGLGEGEEHHSESISG